MANKIVRKFLMKPEAKSGGTSICKRLKIFTMVSSFWRTRTTKVMPTATEIRFLAFFLQELRPPVLAAGADWMMRGTWVDFELSESGQTSEYLKAF